MRKPNKKFADAVEELIEQLLIGYNIEQLVTASSLRWPPGLLEAEKIGFAKKIISASANWIDMEEIDKHANSTDDLINFALDKKLINPAVNIARGFGAGPVTIMRLLRSMEKLAKYYDAEEVKAALLPLVFKITMISERSEEAIAFGINWCIELACTEYAVRLADLRENPGLTKDEMEKLLAEHIDNGDIIESKMICVLLKRELSLENVEQLTRHAQLL